MIYEYFTNDLDKGFKPKKLKDFVKDQCIKKIITEKMLPGQNLNEKDIATELDVSVTPVREAFIELANEGIIELGRYKTPSIPEFSEKDIIEIFEVREVLEAKAAKLAAQKITPEKENELVKIIENREKFLTEKGPDYFNDLFHSKIIEISQNKKIFSMINIIKIQIFTLSVVSRKIPGSYKRSVEWHNRIVEAIIKKEPKKAWDYMSEHIIDAKEQLLKDFYRFMVKVEKEENEQDIV